MLLPRRSWKEARQLGLPAYLDTITPVKVCLRPSGARALRLSPASRAPHVLAAACSPPALAVQAPAHVLRWGQPRRASQRLRMRRAEAELGAAPVPSSVTPAQKPVMDEKHWLAARFLEQGYSVVFVDVGKHQTGRGSGVCGGRDVVLPAQGACCASSLAIGAAPCHPPVGCCCT